jgi:uncharacterized beta barrel domain-containing protein DUF5777
MTRATGWLCVFILLSSAAFAQDDDDTVLQPAQPDFTLAALPTSLRLARFKSAFRVTHRFTRPLDCDTCSSSLFGDLFGLDNGAIIGLEYRFGIVRNGQIGIHRTSDKTIEFFGEYGVVRQDKGLPLDLSVLVSVEGTNNFQDEYSPTIGAIVSRTVGEHAAFYVEPIYVHHANVFQQSIVPEENTFMIGLGARVRVRPTVYVVGEFTPRVSGYRPGNDQGSVAIEKRAGGHMFQLNFSNSFGTTMGQIARGGASTNDWYMGFNITRKFF